MQNLSKKPGRPKKVVIDDTRTEERKDSGIEDATPFQVLSIATDRNGNILGLTNTGEINYLDKILSVYKTKRISIFKL